MNIQRLAWAGIKIEVNQTTLFVDAVSHEGNAKLVVDTPYRHVVVTNPFSQHYDPVSLGAILENDSLLICNVEVLKWIDTRLLRTRATELYEPCILSPANNDLVATPVPAATGFGPPLTSWTVEGGGRKIIHCGGTSWHGCWGDIGDSYGPFDMAFLPINGARQNVGRNTDEGIPGVLTPQQAVAAAKLLGAEAICPIHYDNFDSNYFETPNAEGLFVKAAMESHIKTTIVKLGEWLNWPSG
jgi:L-ascorbate metabolism protein UlaG (beta-lactamase superfamily)